MIGRPATLPTTDAEPMPAAPAACPPDVDELRAAWAAFYELWNAGRVDQTGQHGDEYAAFFDGRVQGFGPDATDLRSQVAARLGVHPERLVISHLAD